MERREKGEMCAPFLLVLLNFKERHCKQDLLVYWPARFDSECSVACFINCCQGLKVLNKSQVNTRLCMAGGWQGKGSQERHCFLSLSMLPAVSLTGNSLWTIDITWPGDLCSVEALEGPLHLQYLVVRWEEVSCFWSEDSSLQAPHGCRTKPSKHGKT